MAPEEDRTFPTTVGIMRVAAATCVWAAVWLCGGALRGCIATGVEEQLWRRVLVEPSWFDNTVRTARQLSPVTACGTACMRLSWCQLWCPVPPTQCLLAALIVSGSYRPSQELTARTCYTAREAEMAFGASITSSDNDYNRAKEKLVDGVFRGNVWDCAAVRADNVTDPWFLVDLGFPRRVSKVVLKAQPNEHAEARFSGTEVKVGDVKQAGNFTSYTLLGRVEAPLVSGQEVTLRPPSPLPGRYVSIQRTDASILQIAHLEIF